ncbi:hypothetical protein WJX73_010260 [Symbiochloris irregularis]|uniref:2'-5' RNA ligase family protein n=1 Tax=Symbiochloris irregularis TaxID=706552 RepID=A0AAW1P0S0_9CHLO
MSTSFSLWVQPKGEARHHLEQEIKHLAQSHGGPCFEAHVTILVFEARDEPEALQVLASVAQNSRPYHIRFQEVSHGSSYYQCIYLLCKQEQATMSINTIAREHCSRPIAQNSGYMPHLSLLYSDADEQARSRIVEQEKTRLQSDSGAMKISGFAVDSLHLWQTPAGDCGGWRHIAEEQLSSPNDRT